ncbi:THAP domain-containing protein 3-like [Brachionichthys hirsutus]|uniref:THAP domain-containing protein 3-like n=1 Tax=Brachionichthys hirsutus TaxID=412623 RepID=UPI0036051B27
MTKTTSNMGQTKQSKEPNGKRKRTLKNTGLQCFAYNCYNYRNKVSKKHGISFHKFPDKTGHGDLYRKWVKACARRDGEPTSNARLCSVHFRPSDINCTMRRSHLRDGAVPSVFSFPGRPKSAKRQTRSSTKDGTAAAGPVEDVEPEHTDAEHVLQVKNLRATAESRRAAADTAPVENASRDQSARRTYHQPVEHFYALPSSPDSLKRKLVEAQVRVEDLDRRLRNATDRERRSRECLKSVFEELQRKKLLNEELEQRLQNYLA